MKNVKFDCPCEIPLIGEPEILVAGGGPAGIAAACCAARRGRRVLLVEREFCLGGTGTGGLVGPFMTSSDPEGKTQLIRGFFRELVDRLIAAGGALEPMSLENCDAHSSWHEFGHRNLTPFNPEVFKLVAEEMCLENGVELLYGAQAVAVIRSPDGERIRRVVLALKEGMAAVDPHMVIDCTGDGDIAAFAGCPMQKGDETTGEMQAAGLFFSLAGIDEARLQARKEALGWESMRFEREIAEAAANGEYPIPRRRLGLYKADDDTWRANITRIPGVDGTRSVDLTRIAVEGRRQIGAILKFLRKYVKGCEEVRLLASAAVPGVRETRRIKGDFILREQSLIDGELFPDAILMLSNSRDNHFGLIGKYIPSTRSYTIPYRALVAPGLENLVVAGRCVSCDRAVLSAIRVMPPCFGMGQAAGNAAALALETATPCARIDVEELRRRLRAENVVLP